MKKKKILKFLLWSFVSLVTAVALLCAWVDWSGSRAWKKVEAELLAKGEPLRLEQIMPPPIPDAQNFAFSPFFKGVFETEKFTESGKVHYRLRFPEAKARLDAFRLPLDPDPPKALRTLHGVPTDIVAWQTYFQAHAEFGLAEAVGHPAADIIKALGNWKVPLDEIASDLRARPQMRAPLLYDQGGFAMTFLHMEGIDQVTALYQLRAIAQTRQGRPDEALADVESLILLRKAAEPRQTLTGNLVATIVTARALSVIREGLAAHTWNDDQLTTLSVKLELLNPLLDYSSALQAERVFFLDGTRRINNGNMQASFGDGNPLQWMNGLMQALRYLPNGYWEYNRATYSRFIQQQLERVLAPNQKRFDVSAHQNHIAELAKLRVLPRGLHHILSYEVLSQLSQVGIISAEMSASISQARIAIALERYHSINGSIPENLTALVSEFLAQIPADPIDGKPLRYQKVSETDYRIWSIGYDQKDGGGVAGAKRTEGDWLWTSLPPQ